LDSFAGSGTTAHAVLDLNAADEGNRQFIAIEMDDDICNSVTRERINKAIVGYKPRKGKAVPGIGGGFRFCRLSTPLFDSDGGFAKDVKFNDLAHHIWFCETGEPLPKGKNRRSSPLLGTHGDIAVYLLFNGVLGDKSASGGNVLTNAILEGLPTHKGQRIIYGEGCRLPNSRLNREGIVFKQIPYEVQGV